MPWKGWNYSPCFYKGGTTHNTLFDTKTKPPRKVLKEGWLQGRKRRVLKGRNPNDSYLLFIKEGWFMDSTWGGDLSFPQVLRVLIFRLQQR
jgi:hypothetical protein